MHLVHVVLGVSWGSLWRVGVSRSRRSWAGPHHAVRWARWGTRTWTHHASRRRPWAWGGSRPRCPSHWRVRSGHVSGETGNVCQEQVAASTPKKWDDNGVKQNYPSAVWYWLIGNKGTNSSKHNKKYFCWGLKVAAKKLRFTLWCW